MDVELEISSRFSILFEICTMVKETNNAYDISPKILRTRRIQRRYTHARPAPACGRMTHMLITEFTLARWRHTDAFPYSRFCLLFLVSKKIPYYFFFKFQHNVRVPMADD
jgi:hypothetical protein